VFHDTARYIKDRMLAQGELETDRQAGIQTRRDAKKQRFRHAGRTLYLAGFPLDLDQSQGGRQPAREAASYYISLNA